MNPLPAAQLRDNLQRVRERIAAACARAGRKPENVTLIAVTKTVPAGAARPLHEMGALDLGENRVQEAQEKISGLQDLGFRWHLIGHLQRNKAKFVPGAFHRLHSLDNTDLASELEKRCAAAGVTLPCTVEVNVGNEPQKHGITAEQLPALLESARALPHLNVDGLMTVPPAQAGEKELRGYFSRLRELASAHRLGELSMGMTNDFEIAIEEGATMIRVGRAIFGERH